MMRARRASFRACAKISAALDVRALERMTTGACRRVMGTAKKSGAARVCGSKDERPVRSVKRPRLFPTGRNEEAIFGHRFGVAAAVVAQIKDDAARALELVNDVARKLKSSIRREDIELDQDVAALNGAHAHGQRALAPDA